MTAAAGRGRRSDDAGDYRLLDWDSEFFGFTVAAIAPPRLDREQLGGIVSRLRTADVRLAYWPSDAARRIDDRTIADLGGRLVDDKLTYVVDLDDLGDLEPAGARVRPFRPTLPLADLETLAVQSGENSRFAVDPDIPRAKFEQLYVTWVRRSVSRDLADEVLVTSDGGTVTGMITVKQRAETGVIGLIAVDRRLRGRKLGEALVRAAQRWFRSRGCRRGRVVTQGRSLAACRLYAKCGYRLERAERFYHFWLGASD